jgi:hypothetical protein
MVPATACLLALAVALLMCAVRLWVLQRALPQGAQHSGCHDHSGKMHSDAY